jgi:acyl carrier protein
MADRQDILNKLVEFLESDTDVRPERIDDALSLREGLGLDSVDLVGIIMRIEGHYRIRMSHGDLEKVATVGTLLDLIQDKIAASAADPPSQSKAA